MPVVFGDVAVCHLGSAVIGTRVRHSRPLEISSDTVEKPWAALKAAFKRFQFKPDQQQNQYSEWGSTGWRVWARTQGPRSKNEGRGCKDQSEGHDLPLCHIPLNSAGTPV